MQQILRIKADHLRLSAQSALSAGKFNFLAWPGGIPYEPFFN
jgi:hypothetical protein